MMTRIDRVGVTAIAGALLWAVAAWGASPVPEATSLHSCQMAVQRNAATYITKKGNALKGCLNAISKLVIAGQELDASAAAATCVRQLRLISDSRGLGKSLAEKLTAGIAGACDPAVNPSLTHTAADVLGPGASLAEPLNVGGIGVWCETFEGNGAIVSVPEWIDCVTNAAECAVDTAISTQYPRALQWLTAVRPAMEAMPPPPTDPSKISDALAGLDAVKSTIDGPNNDNEPSVSCGQGGQVLTCQADLDACTGSLGTCTTELSTCSTDLGTCNAGTATAGDVLNGKTFSSSAGLGATGTMPDNGAVIFMPSTTAQTIPAGYHSGSGSVAGDANLVSGNIRSGTSLFGVAGSSSVVDTSGTTATAADMASGKTAYVNGGLVTGSVVPGSNVNGPNGSATFTIPDGLYSGSKTATANDSNLMASNILQGINIFGVTGTVLPGQRLKTGQTQCDPGYGGLVSCPGSPAGQDGALSKGLARQYIDNGDGTITDTKTGLMWEKLDDNDGGGIHDQDDFYTWYDAFTTKIATLNSGGGFAGHTDWRLPNTNELQSLIDYGRSGPAIDPSFNTRCSPSCTVTTCSCTYGLYWASTTYQDSPYYAWYIDFYDGVMSYDGKDSSTHHVRAVRDGL